MCIAKSSRSFEWPIHPRLALDISQHYGNLSAALHCLYFPVRLARLSLSEQEDTVCVSSMKMISWHPSINRPHLPIPVESCRPLRADRLQDNPPLLPLFSRLPFLERSSPLLFPSLFRPFLLSCGSILSFAPSSLLAHSIAYVRTYFYAAFTALSCGSSFCAADEERKKLLERPFIPQRPQV